MGRTRSVAARVVLSYRAVGAEPGEWDLADSEWIRGRMAEESYLTYLKRVHEGPIAVGEGWEEFVNCGCASPQDVRIRVEGIEGGDALGMATDIEILPRHDLVTP